MTTITVHAPAGIGEVVEGTDLADLIRGVTALVDGDIVVITSKVISKAAGRVVSGTRETHVADETVEVVARRGRTSITRNRQGVVQAAAGVDDSNVELGRCVLLPLDPDASARRIREALAEHANVAVLISDTAGRPWRLGQTDIAIGAAGVVVLEDFGGRADPYGNRLVVTAPALADELAGAGDLVKSKLAGRPIAVIRGLQRLVLPQGEHGAGADSLVRPVSTDMFALGTREAVTAAVTGQRREAFGGSATAEELSAALSALDVVLSREHDGLSASGAGDDLIRAAIIAFAHGWRGTSHEGQLILRADLHDPDCVAAQPRL